MFKLVAFALVALAAVSAVSGVAILPRQTPSGWDSDSLESYEGFSTRYHAMSCQNQRNTQFFDDCCQPLKKGEALSPSCSSGTNPSSTPSEPPSNTLISEPPSSPAPEPRSDPDSDDDCEDDDDEINDDEEEDCERYNPPSSSPAYEPSSTPPSVPTPYNDPEPTPTPISTPTPEPSPSSSADDPTPSSSPDQNTTPNSETHTDAVLTWFDQGGVAGACGQVHLDSDLVAALDARTYGDTGAQSTYCGKTIRVTWQDQSVDVIVADACPTCDNASSVDLSLAAFQALAPLDEGKLTGASWTLL